MAKKYHISDNGEVVECRANKIPCKKQNFNSQQEAEEHLESTLASPLSKFSPSGSRQNAHLSKMRDKYGTDHIHSYTMSSIDKPTNELLSSLSSVGSPLIVGGSVRDSLVGSESKDIDIEVHKTSMNALIKHLKSSGYNVNEVGKQFGVLKVTGHGLEETDISVPRKENKVGSGHKSFNTSFDPEMSITEAAERRDFTFNAIMYDHQNNVLIDPTGGKEDLENKVMRHVSDKFTEDPLRVLRGAQFATRFNMSYHPDTAKISKQIRHEYNDLSKERLREEWGKFLEKGKNPRSGIKALQDSGWDDMTTGLKESLSSEHTQQSLERVTEQPKEYRALLGSAAIMTNMEKKNREKFSTTSLMSKSDEKVAMALCDLQDSQWESTYDRKVAAKSFPKGVDFELVHRYATVTDNSVLKDHSRKAISEGLGKEPEKDLISGSDIMMKTERTPGPWMAQLLNEIRDNQYKNNWTNRKDALDYMNKRLEQMA